MNLVVTSYPEMGSANVGDLLITTSFIELAQSIGVLSDCETLFREIPFSDKVIERYGRTPIFLPGMSISSNSYPKLYSLSEQLSEIPVGLIPFGCTWQHPIGNIENAETAGYSNQTLALLQQVSGCTGPIAVRDHMAAGILSRNGIPSVTVGDCAWYHLPSRGKGMRRSKRISRLVVTTPHSNDLTAQCIQLIEMLGNIFPETSITLSLHSQPTAHTKKIIENIDKNRISVIEAAGDEEIFEKYDEYDLHVGYRLHGHIGFIRRRIPSVLLMEDARSRGFSTSIPPGCFPAKKMAIGPDILARLTLAFARQYVTPDTMVVSRVRTFLEQEVATGFLRYVGIPNYLDSMLTEVFIPQLREKTSLAKKAIASI